MGDKDDQRQKFAGSAQSSRSKMMIIRCERCGKKYKLNSAMKNSDERRFNCHNCNHSIILNKLILKSHPMNHSKNLKEELSSQLILNETDPFVDEENTERKKRGRFGIIPRLTLIMALICLIPLIAFAAFSLYQTSHYLKNEMANNREEVITNLASNVDEWIDKNVRSLNTLANMPDIQSMDSVHQLRLLQVTQKAYPWMYLVFTLNTKGENIARSDGAPLKDYSERQYFRKILAGKKLAFQTLIGKTSQMPSMVLSVPIMNNDKLVGVLAAAMTTDELSKNVVTWKKGHTGFAFLVDETGKVLAHRHKEYVSQEKNISDHPLFIANQEGLSGNIHFVKSDGQAYVGVALNTAYGWTLAIEESAKEAFSVLRDTQYVALVTLIITIIGVIFINIGLGRTITRPIRALTSAANHISLGKLEIEIDIKRNDEIGDLAEAIERMKDSIRLSFQRLKRLSNKHSFQKSQKPLRASKNSFTSS